MDFAYASRANLPLSSGPANKARRSFSLRGSESTYSVALPKSSISRSFSCWRNPGLGDTCGRACRICWSAAFRDICRRFIRYAATTIGEREIPAEQCTRILPVPLREFNAASMTVHAVSQTLAMEDEGESLSDTRWYVTPSTLLEGLAPTLSTVVMAFVVRNCFEDAAEQGPKYNEGGSMSETGGCLLACAWSRFIMVADSEDRRTGA